MGHTAIKKQGGKGGGSAALQVGLSNRSLFEAELEAAIYLKRTEGQARAL